ncbi:unnamed protein product [Leptosia nina]|uniref:Cyclic nucleotide-binding domain-containing protein n=1 Tax=Leptosia nina TaxID=320188 RepID=A0AAV1K3W3_9NEOP
MTTATLPSKYYDDDEEEEVDGDQIIHWSNLLFLPFNPTVKAIVLIAVIIKTVMGPIQAVYPIVYCWDTLDYDTSLILLKGAYLYLCDPIYSIDTLLHILHRQITDEAMKREYLPKSGFLILLDIVSLIPFFSLLQDGPCAPVEFSPNIYAFSEFVIIYRIADSFSILSSHKIWQIAIGYTLMLIISVNCITCFFILLTMLGFCPRCNDGVYDWRKFVFQKFNETDTSFSTYVYAASFVLTFFVNNQYDETKPSTINEYILMDAFMLMGYLLLIFVVIPKMVAESMLRLRRMGSYYPKVQRIIDETRRRNISPKAHEDVKDFYSLIWEKRSGITSVPEVISEIPRYLRVEIRLDLVWPIFYHSPTFRKTSNSYKRWLCEVIRMDYKLPGEKFFAGPNCYTHFYYLKSGKIQLISVDDGVTPLITLTSGTILGDISFYLPTPKRKVFVQCITYCEVLYITRVDVLSSLHKHPIDRRLILQHAKDRVRHARTLYTCKQHVRGLDRTEDEGVSWVKKRWWEISDAVRSNRLSIGIDALKCKFSVEETAYHCAKYIGQLVLTGDEQLQTKSSFLYTKFPWILVPHSYFVVIWHRIVVGTVFFVLVLYPPYLSTKSCPMWFVLFQLWTDVIYICDIFVMLLTAMDGQDNIGEDYTIVIFSRCKTGKFMLDVLSSVWIETLASVSGFPQLYNLLQFNRLIKIYVLFSKWDIRKDPLFDVIHKIALIFGSFSMITSYLLYMFDRAHVELRTSYFFGEIFVKCNSTEATSKCDIEFTNPYIILLAWLLEFIFYEYLPGSLLDIYVIIVISYIAFLIFVYSKTDLVAMFYLKYREIVNYQYFVSNIKDHYRHYKVHPGLLMRLNKYLICHWKYFKGMDVLHPNLLKNEPYDIYWKLQGEIAEKIIRESPAFVHADPAFIKELAYKAKFLMLPKNCTVSVFGVQTKTVTWIVQGYITSEYHDLQGEVYKKLYCPGDFVSTCAVFLGRPSLRTLYASTECEVLYMKVIDFFHILKSYPNEWSFFDVCLEKYMPVYDKMVEDYVKKYKDLAYYNSKGLLITDLSERLKHYMRRGFICDVIGSVPINPIVSVVLSRRVEQDEEALIYTASKFAHFYLIMGYFDYLSDMPNRNIAFYMIIKMQVMTILVTLGACHYFVSRCISFVWDDKYNMINMTRRNHCWLPSHLPLDEHPTLNQLQIVYAESFNLAQSGLMRFNLGKFHIDREYLGVGITLCILGIMFWFVMCYSLTLLVLNFRGNTLFQHGVGQLRRFLQAERVDKKLIETAMTHFRYWWFRTIEAADTLLHGGESLERQLVSAATQWFFLPGEVIVREMDLSPWVYIVHRGSILIKQDDEELAKLTKGSIFGQLDGIKPRPVRITAVADGYADLLQIPIKDFQDVIGDETRERIKHCPQAKHDFMAVKKTVIENPYNSLPYILRGRKTIKLPWMATPLRARTDTWYARWLYLCWFIFPAITAFIVLLAKAVPDHCEHRIYWILFVLDLFHIVYLLTEFYTLKLVVQNGECVERIQKWHTFKNWSYYIDILSLTIPILTHFTGDWNYRLARLLRLRHFYYFHHHFCKGFKSQIAPILLKFVIVFLSIHSMTCGWIYVACQHEKFPIQVPPLPAAINKTIDYDEWVHPTQRRGGCPRLTKNFIVDGKVMFGLVVPKNWMSDYIVAITHILVIYTHTEIDIVVSLTLEEMYYKVLLNLIIHPMEIWVLSCAISAVYTKFRELFTYDYDVQSLILYLEHNGLSSVLLDSVKEYTKQLWQRQRGNWLPELAQQAPQCLREDMLCALYMHHVETPPLFRELPEYFRRQLVTKLQRVVIFPGKYIVQEGDIFSCMYFIHEGEVEKWYTDKSGEKKMLSLLSTNGYFGLIPGLFPNTPYQFSYYSRTVVDFVFLRHRDWQDLLQGYPKIKYDLYTAAKQLKKDLQKNIL